MNALERAIAILLAHAISLDVETRTAPIAAATLDLRSLLHDLET